MKLTRCVLLALMFTMASLFCLSQEVFARPGSASGNPGRLAVSELGSIARTPERLTRGKYLVEGLLQCTLCHSETDFSKRPTEPRPGTRGAGRVFERSQAFGPGSRIVASNLTSDSEYGTGNWSDSDFVRALRQGIGHDGRRLFPMMPYKYFRSLSDEDLAAVIVYERSLAPVHIERPKTVLPESVTRVLQPLPPVEHVPEPDRSDPVSYGKYLVTGAHCVACHTPHDDLDNLVPGLEFAGGQVLTGPFGPNGQTIQVASLNLTPDPSGISYFDEKKFIEVIRSGSVSARPLATIMPWSYFRNLTDDDLKAIFAYLRTLKPVKHRVDNTEPPTYCRVCGKKHGMGNLN
jgi:Cytochrome c